MSCVPESVLKGYLTSSPSHFMDKAGGWAENADRLFGLGQHGAGLGYQIFLQTGHSGAADQFKKVSNGFGAAGDALGATRVIFPLEKLLSGKMFFATNRLSGDLETGEFKVDKDGNYELRDFLSIACDILILAGRILSPIGWLHGLGVYDLGKHAKRMGHASMAIWGAVISIDAIQTIRGMIDLDPSQQDYQEKIRKGFAEVVCNILDLAALPFEFGHGMNTGVPGLAIAGAGIIFIAKGSYLVKEMVLYS